jgi:hypothetical protein
VPRVNESYDFNFYLFIFWVGGSWEELVWTPESFLLSKFGYVQQSLDG